MSRKRTVTFILAEQQGEDIEELTPAEVAEYGVLIYDDTEEETDD